MHLSDGFGRTFQYLRLSVTEACNFRCTYCLPEGYKKCAGPSFLSIDELYRAAKAFSELGLGKIRLTGGEPTIRRDFDDIVWKIGALPKVQKLALTTNGYRLENRVNGWVDAGLGAINISLDSLNRETFHQVTGHDRRDEVLRGIEAALSAGCEDVKINVVYMRGINDHEVGEFIKLAKSARLSIRFIELMQTGDHADFFKKHHSPVSIIETQLQQSGWTQMIKASNAGPANNYRHADYRGSVGLIAPYAKDFCNSCNRLRFSSLGKLHLCLFGEFGLSMRHYLQSDEQIDELKSKIIQAVKGKRAAHYLHSGQTGMTQNLSAIGG